MKTIYLLTLSALTFIVFACADAQNYRTSKPPLVETKEKNIDKITNELQKEHLLGTFDGLITISKGNSILFKHAYGFADRKDRRENTTETIIDIGSIAKTFTAASILQLAAQDKLKLTNTIGDYYPSASEKVASITIEQLLTHSSGMDNFHNDSDFELMNKSEAVDRILSMPLIFNAGAKIAYSNAAYTLLASVVEQISGQTFKEYVIDNLIVPFGLSNTGFYGDPHIKSDRLALGYGGERPGKTTFERELTWALIGAGGWYPPLMIWCYGSLYFHKERFFQKILQLVYLRL